MSAWSELMGSLLGKRVEVTLTDDATEKVVGILHDFSDWGEVSVLDDSGRMRYAWPNLHIREVAS